MSDYDFGELVESASKVLEESDGNGDYEYDLLYPFHEGKLKVRLLFNKESKTAMREILRHRVDTDDGTIKNPCLKQFGKECRTCQAVENVNNAKDMDLWQNSANKRGISFVQFIGAEGYPDGADLPDKGETIILMYPRQVYLDLNEIITDNSDKIEKILTDYDGMQINIKRSEANDRVDYKAIVDPFETFKSVSLTEKEKQKLDSKEEAEQLLQKKMDNLLEDLTPLEEVVYPADFRDDYRQTDIELAKEIEKKHLGTTSISTENQSRVDESPLDNNENHSSNSQEAVVEETQTDNEPEVENTQEESSGGEEVEYGGDKPPCFGDHYAEGSHNEDECLICNHEVQCQEVTEGN